MRRMGIPIDLVLKLSADLPQRLIIALETTEVPTHLDEFERSTSNTNNSTARSSRNQTRQRYVRGGILAQHS
jgi:hypothetical protein